MTNTDREWFNNTSSNYTLLGRVDAYNNNQIAFGTPETDEFSGWSRETSFRELIMTVS